jgi:hypothetical protein
MYELEGEDVPNPKLPELLNLPDSTPPSANAIVSAAGKKIPVLVSPTGCIEGSVAEPAGKAILPVNATLPVSD